MCLYLAKKHPKSGEIMLHLWKIWSTLQRRVTHMCLYWAKKCRMNQMKLLKGDESFTPWDESFLVDKSFTLDEIFNGDKSFALDETFLLDKIFTLDESYLLDKSFTLDETFLLDKSFTLDESYLLDRTFTLDESFLLDATFVGENYLQRNFPRRKLYTSIFLPRSCFDLYFEFKNVIPFAIFNSYLTYIQKSCLSLL